MHTAFTCSKNIACSFYFKELLEISTRFIQIEQLLQIEAKLLQIGAAPVAINQSNSYFKFGAVPVITNWGKIIANWVRLLQITAEQ